MALSTRWPNPIDTTVNMPGHSNLSFHRCSNQGVFKSDKSRPPQAIFDQIIWTPTNTLPAALQHALLEPFDFTQSIAWQESPTRTFNHIHDGFSHCCSKTWRGLYDLDIPRSILEDFQRHGALWPLRKSLGSNHTPGSWRSWFRHNHQRHCRRWFRHNHQRHWRSWPRHHHQRHWSWFGHCAITNKAMSAPRFQ